MTKKRVLLIDALNLFMRNYIVDPSLSTNGQPIGGGGWLCRADRPGRQRVDVFLPAGSRQPAKHQSAAAHDCLSIALPRG